MFNWDDLRYFLTLQRSNTLASAGAALHLDPSTVGRRLLKLEAQLGARLFDKTKEGYVLTEAGSRLLPRAERIEQEALSVERQVVGEDGRLHGIVRLAATEVLAARFVAPHLRRFRERYPDIQLDLICSDELVNLSRREADVALRLSRPTQDELFIKRLAVLRLGLYASKDYVERNGMPTGAFEGHQLICFPARPPFQAENSWLQTQAGKAQIVSRVDSVPAMYSATRAGIGIALLPCLIADEDPRLLRVPHGVAPEPREIWQAVHKDLKDSARVRAVLEFLGQILSGPAGNEAGQAAA